MRRCWPLVLLLLPGCTAPSSRQPEKGPEVRVGSKEDVEGGILGEMVVQLARSAGARTDYRRFHGKLVWEALRRGDVDVYPEYTGTLSNEIFAGRDIHGEEALRRTLADMGIRMGRPLGFSNTYAIGMKEEVAERLGVRTISDLRRHPDLRFGFSNEFMGRKDCWPNLRAVYGLPQRDVRGMDHSLAYQALNASDIQATDLYSTDAEIRAYNLRVLEDDLRSFPDYQAVLLYRAELEERAPDVVHALRKLEGKIPESTMIEMNAAARNDKRPASQVAADFLGRALGVQTEVHEPSALEMLARRTGQHLRLVTVSLLAGILVAVPLGIAAARRPRWGQVVLSTVGVIQTIPSLALLVFMMPLFDGLLELAPGLQDWDVSAIGRAPAIVALFLYSLLPIVRNTYAGLHDISPHLRESAEALGLAPLSRLRLIELPLAARTILAGIKTAAVINVGYATLGAFIGAGGYGEAIVTGMTRGDRSMVIWQGAVPAAVMALAVQGLFELVERFCVPKGLRLKPVN